jgi:hypothetical protein
MQMHLIMAQSTRSETVKPISVNAKIYTSTEGSLEETYFDTYIFEVLESKQSVDPTNGIDRRVLMISNRTAIVHIVDEIEKVMTEKSHYKNRCKFRCVRYCTFANKYTFLNGTNLHIMTMSSVPNVSPHSDKITKELCFTFTITD